MCVRVVLVSSFVGLSNTTFKSVHPERHSLRASRYWAIFVNTALSSWPVFWATKFLQQVLRRYCDILVLSSWVGGQVTSPLTDCGPRAQWVSVAGIFAFALLHPLPQSHTQRSAGCVTAAYISGLKVYKMTSICEVILLFPPQPWICPPGLLCRINLKINYFHVVRPWDPEHRPYL